MSGPSSVHALTSSLETIAAMGDNEPVSLPVSRGLTRVPVLPDIVAGHPAATPFTPSGPLIVDGR